ncbi:hypothetical protein JL193_11220 [Polaribacter batillariae]|uniref:YD repeat-containing protein n=1 Tax=Polaribacter batillariae TaxID=2808900 RepID=A0ABX7SR60_9FLAO|nr:hypothetical protein [Polaribacter batillariae]QTD36707.1 hypothetical protein JL193_11220 [Polaribacter batillariae]
MQKLFTLLFVLLIIPSTVFSQIETYTLASKNLHRKVRKTTTNYYTYDNNSGGFVLRSTSIERFNDDGNLVETLYQYNGSYAKTQPTKKLYHYNNKKQLVEIQDISAVRKKYSVNIKFTYNSDGNVTKKNLCI